MTVGEEDAVLELLTWRLIIYYRIVKHCDRQRAQWTWLPLELRSGHLKAIYLPFSCVHVAVHYAVCTADGNTGIPFRRS